MDQLCELMEKISLNNFTPERKYWVTVTHINSPSSFYVRPLTYDKYLEETASPGGIVQPSDLNMPSIFVFRSRNIQKFTRGVVVEAHEGRSTRYDMFAIDEGFTEKLVRLTNIYKCNSQLIPPLASHCQLAHCKPLGKTTWTEREIDAMKYYVGTEKALMVVVENDPQLLTVLLINSCPDDISKLMALTGYSHMGFGSNQIGRVTAPVPQKAFFHYKSLKVGDILRVRIQCGKALDNFYVAEKQDYKVYLQDQSNFTYFSRQLKDLTTEELQEELPVGVRNENVYERGIVRKVISETRAEVQLIDWGKVEEYNIGSLKPMSEKFFYNPAIAIYCSLAEDEVSDYRLRKYLYPGYEFKIEILELGEKHTKPNIVKIIPV